MGPATVEALRAAVTDPATVGRYWQHVRVAEAEECWYWLGAVSGRGHGRFQIADAYSVARGERRRHTYVVIAHRFGYALRVGVDALLSVPIVAHRCDNPLCQNPQHWRESDPASNRREWAARRREILGPLADMRGSRGRARAVRDAVRSGANVEAVELEGASELHREQLPLFAELAREYGAVGSSHPVPEVSTEPDAEPEAQPGLFDVES